MTSLWRPFKNKWITPPKETTETFTGRTIIITGATSGIGLEAAVKFVNLGAEKVILAARDLAKATSVLADIERRTGTQGKDVLEVWQLDMASYASVTGFAQRANKELEHLDIAILNAGVWKSSWVDTASGWEETLQVNTLSTILLAILLIPKLLSSETKKRVGKTPVLEITNSGIHQSAKIDPKALDSESILGAYNDQSNGLFKPASQYGKSKLFTIYCTNMLASHISSEDLIITSVCPGMVATSLAREVQFFGVSIAMAIFGFFFLRSPEQGSRILVSGTCQGEMVHGRFWQHDRVQPLGESVKGEGNRKIAERVWGEVAGALQRDVPEVRVREVLGRLGVSG